MTTQIGMSEADLAPWREDDGTRAVLPDLSYLRLSIVNVAFVGLPGADDRNWVLVDTGLFTSHGAIIEAATARFGKGARPAAILLTHGHFDHVGTVKQLAEEWEAPVYAHELEQPFLDGTKAYPPADPFVGGGLMALLSPLYPRSPIDLRPHLRVLPADGSVPGLPDWRWIHTPGHAPGHVSFWRDGDRTLIAGDAVVTTGQESAYEVARQEPEMHGPPRYFTPDWGIARRSVEALAALEPELILSGHGAPLAGSNMRSALHRLAAEFDQIAVPESGRNIRQPAEPRS